MARRKDQDARRTQLVRATMQSIAELGLAGTTLNSVAERAGTSPRLIAYYYRHLESLVEAAHEAATDRFYVGRRDGLAECGSAPEKLARLIRSGLPRGDDILLSQVLNELAVSAARHTNHANLMARLYQAETSLYAEVLREGAETGDFELTAKPDELARTFVALEDGFGVYLLAVATPVDTTAAERALVGLARAVTGADITAALA